MLQLLSPQALQLDPLHDLIKNEDGHEVSEVADHRTHLHCEQYVPDLTSFSRANETLLLFGIGIDDETFLNLSPHHLVDHVLSYGWLKGFEVLLSVQGSLHIEEYAL